jgi:hypothetical protein
LRSAGFSVEVCVHDGGEWIQVSERRRTLPDFVGPGMRLLMVGLNPSEYSADRGFGFAPGQPVLARGSAWPGGTHARPVAARRGWA